MGLLDALGGFAKGVGEGAWAISISVSVEGAVDYIHLLLTG